MYVYMSILLHTYLLILCNMLFTCCVILCYVRLPHILLNYCLLFTRESRDAQGKTVYGHHQTRSELWRTWTSPGMKPKNWRQTAEWRQRVAQCTHLDGLDGCIGPHVDALDAGWTKLYGYAVATECNDVSRLLARCCESAFQYYHIA